MATRYELKPKRRSVATKIVIAWSICAALLAGLGTIYAYVVAKADEEAFAMRSLSRYATERAVRESQRFDDLARLEKLANENFGAALRSIDPARVDAEFDRLFPLRADGTRRSIDALYTGYSGGDGNRIFGVGAFIADGSNLTAEEKAQLLAALHIVSRFGEGISFQFDSFYFFTPKNRLVIFAPKRADKLEFYRQQAPATFSFAFEEMVQITLPAANPGQEMQCTSLQHILYDRSFRTWTTGCMTPATVDGVYVGAWGVSLLLDELMAQSIEERAPGTENMILTGDGKLIAHRFFTEQGSEKTEAYLDIAASGNSKLARIADFAAGARRSTKISYLSGYDRYVAAAPLRGPDWRFVILANGSEVRSRAMKLALKMLAIVTICAIALTLILRWLLRFQVAKPLRNMAEAVDRHRRKSCDVEALSRQLPIGRDDEIGSIARRLAAGERKSPTADREAQT